MNIENIYEVVRGIGSEIAVNIANSAKSLTRQSVDKDRVVTWSHTFGHLRLLKPAWPSSSSLGISDGLTKLAVQISQMDPLGKMRAVSSAVSNWILITAKKITTIENWSNAQTALVQTVGSWLGSASKKLIDFRGAVARVVRQTPLLSKLMKDAQIRKSSGATDHPQFIPNGELIRRQFHVFNSTFAEEQISREATVAAALDMHIKQRGYLQANRHHFEKAESMIEHHQRAEDLAAHKLAGSDGMKNKDWIDSNYFRHLLKYNPGIPFKELANRFISAPVNMRYHSLELSHTGEKAGFYRLGVITDPTNGWTNLQELKKMAAGDQEGQQLRIDRIEQIQSRASRIRTNARMKESAEFACDELFDLERTIARRRQILEDQMLQLIVAQVEKNAESIGSMDASTPFTMVHLSLLNPKLKKLDATGWMHDEANQILDMAEIFKEFRGRELVFDGKGPFIDEQGKIHLPQEGANWPKSLTLNPVFLNTTVQRHTKNVGMQAEINREGMEELRRVLGDRDDSISAQALPLLERAAAELEAGKSNYAIAEMIGFSIAYAKLPFSSGCMSGKDRTGLVAELIMHDLLSKGIDEQYADRSARFRYRVKRRFADMILDENGPAARVILDNTGEKILKCSSPRFPKISPLKRLQYAFKQIRMTF